MRKNQYLLIIVMLFMSCTSYSKKGTESLAGLIKGKVVYQNQGLIGARIYAYKKDAKSFSLLLSAKSDPSDENGIISLNLKSGVYYLVVRKAGNTSGEILDKGDYFSYFGGNPVRVTDGGLIEITINCIKKSFSQAEVELSADKKKDGISGVVLYEDKPLEAAEIFFYLSMETDLRGPAYFSTVTDKQGRFYVPLEAGTYYLVCRKRAPGLESFGPIQAGDFFGYYEANPVLLKEGEGCSVPIFVLKKEVIKDSTNIITTSGMATAGQTVISGKVINLTKNPEPGVYVCLYRNTEMVGKPDYISNKTMVDGSFEINLAEGGKFYLIAKENFGAIPEPGDFIGYLADSKDHSLEITTNKNITNLEIIGDKILSK